MIDEGDRVLLVGEGREFFTRAGPGKLSTDKGQIELAGLIGAEPGAVITTHTGAEFVVRIPGPLIFSYTVNGPVHLCSLKTSAL